MADPEKGEGPGFTPHALGDLDDVLRTPPADGNTLVWDAAAGQWKPGAGGGGGLPSWFQSGSGLPVGVVTPSQQGALYQDTTNGALYVAVDITSADWVAAAGRAPNDGSVYGVLAYQSINITAKGNTAVYLTDVLALVGSGNAAYWTANGADGAQTFSVLVGPSGAGFETVFKPDGGLQLPNGNSLYNTAAAPSNTVGANGDWSLGADGHIYYRTAGAWVQKV